MLWSTFERICEHDRSRSQCSKSNRCITCCDRLWFFPSTIQFLGFTHISSKTIGGFPKGFELQPVICPPRPSSSVGSPCSLVLDGAMPNAMVGTTSCQVAWYQRTQCPALYSKVVPKLCKETGSSLKPPFLPFFHGYSLRGGGALWAPHSRPSALMLRTCVLTYPSLVFDPFLHVGVPRRKKK